MVTHKTNTIKKNTCFFFVSEIPKDPIIQEYIVSFADKIRAQTSARKYQGHLVNDSVSLGLTVDQLEKIMKPNNSTTSIARELFKEMVPENRRYVSHWNQLDEDILMKEKTLISM